MKTLLFAFAILFVIDSYGQDSIYTKDFYLQKSKSQKTTGWVLLAGGAVLGAAGAAIFADSDFLDAEDPNTDFGGYMMLAGGAAVVASIPFFISSATNARKAAMIVISTQKVPVMQQNKTAFQLQPSIGLRISF